jgi:hypothetical protein
VRYVDPSGMTVVEVSPGAFLDTETGLPVESPDCVDDSIDDRVTRPPRPPKEIDDTALTDDETRLLARAFAQYALLYVGYPYRWGANGWFEVDCSGLCMSIFWALGFEEMPDMTAHEMYNLLTIEITGSLRAGDLRFFDLRSPNCVPGKKSHVDHVQIITSGSGDRVNASGPGEPTRVELFSGPLNNRGAVRRINWALVERYYSGDNGNWLWALD